MNLYLSLHWVNKQNGMKTTKTTKTKDISWALPGESISLDEFKKGIKKAEKGPFMTLDELKKSVEEWEKSQNL
jgi:hypothetical protein